MEVFYNSNDRLFTLKCNKMPYFKVIRLWCKVIADFVADDNLYG